VSTLLEEALESPEVVDRQLADAECALYVAERLASEGRPAAVTVARGSGAHAAHYFSTLALARLGLPAPPLPEPLLTSRAALRMHGWTALAFSPAGDSPDLTQTMSALGALGARTVALVNASSSPLGDACESRLPLLAGVEVGATAVKSHIGVLSRAAQLAGYWARCARGDRTLLEALKTLPQKLLESCMVDWDTGMETLVNAQRLSIIASGPWLGVAREMALTLKTACGIRADAFAHEDLAPEPGRLRACGISTPVLVLAPRSTEQAPLIELAAQLQSRGTATLLAAPGTISQADLPLVSTCDPALDPIAAMQSFYVMAARLAERGAQSPRPAYVPVHHDPTLAPSRDCTLHAHV
jgi:glutamine---fructose-6-phosphate transaminase (isomerizing)